MSQRVLTAIGQTPRPARAGSSVTVVIPCFNYARFLPQSVGSALSQVGVVVDVIVVDDASTDASADVARRLADGDARIQILVNERNSGAVETFNRGLAEARGEFVVRLDADDLLTPGSLERAVAVMQANPSVGLVYGHPLHFSGDDLPLPRSESSLWTVWSGKEWLAQRCRSGSNVITSPEVLMRRSVVDEVGGQRALAHTHDFEMWMRIASRSDVAYIRGADQAWHRDHPASLSTQAEQPLIILAELRDAFDVLVAGLPAGIMDGDALRAQAHRAVALQALAYARRTADRGQMTGEAESLRDFASACDPTVVVTNEWTSTSKAFEGGGNSRLRSAMGLLPRVRRRLRYRIAQTRWHRTGMYERFRVVRGRADDSTAGRGIS